MRWDDFKPSDHVEDRRGGNDDGPQLGFPMPTGGGGGRSLGLGTIVVLGLLGYAIGVDPRLLIQGAEMLSGGGQSISFENPSQTPRRAPSSKPQDDMGRFASAILGNTEEVWTAVLPDQVQIKYKPPRMVLFAGATRSGCGAAQSAMGPFYTPRE
jgi:predicted metalloprotease